MKFGMAFVFLSALFILFPDSLLYGQVAAEMDKLLESREITWAEVCRFVLPASGILQEHSAAPAAFALARENGWLPKGAAADGPASLGGLSFLIMQSFSIKGSVLYALFPGPRYAYRQLDYLGLLPGLRDPALKVSGERLLQILGRVLTYRGDGEPDASAYSAGTEPAALPELPPEERARDRVQEQREQMAEEIRAALETGGVADTTVRVAEEGVAISLDNIQFSPDGTELTETERIKLMRVAVILSRYPDRKILVGGHTALAGTAAGRLEVSARRAQTVADFLVFLDSRRPEEVTVRGYGAERPLGDAETEEGRALNRRVEITILDE
ncbi:MAG: OmpA family protein [Treponema sp.]|jgi:outer membrane protein OmpA-like peptidoglycan-associated protein|nr:OmpA family protein [Treponema sp.]